MRLAETLEREMRRPRSIQDAKRALFTVALAADRHDAEHPLARRITDSGCALNDALDALAEAIGCER